MASLQADATPGEDVISETKAATNDAQVVAPPPPPPPVDPEMDEDNLEAPAYQEKAEWDSEEEKDTEYSPFTEVEDEPPFTYDAGEPASFGHFNEDNNED